MEYRKLGKLGYDVSALGFGCMRLPQTDEELISANIDEKMATKMVRGALDRGVNYIDTAYLYHYGASEEFLGRALKDGYRDKVMLATKLPVGFIKSGSEFNIKLDEQLKRLQTDTIDFYLLHALNRNLWDFVKNEGIIELAEAAKKAGKIKHIGFSFHDDYGTFEQIINEYDSWDMCQIQYNFMDTEDFPGTRGLKLAASKDIGVVVMEPLRGGKLANPVQEITDLLKESGYKESLVELALKWVWSQKEVSLLLSGMSDQQQVDDNLVYAERSGVNKITKEELELIAKIKELYAKRTVIPCTGCSYCMPCPQGINIPMTLDTYNDAVVYKYLIESKRFYSIFGKEASKCVQCKECESKCPQSIKISDWMAEIDTALT